MATRYTSTSIASTPSNAIKWIQTYAKNSNVVKNSAGTAWVFTVTIAICNKWDIDVHNWNNGRNSIMNVVLREGSATGPVISTAAVAFTGTAMTGWNQDAVMATVTIPDIVGTAKRIYVEIHADLRGVYGTNGKRGIYWVNANTNVTDLYEYGYFDVSDIVLGSAPVLGNITNTNKYDSQNGISASSNSINIGWKLVGGNEPTSMKYRLNSGNWISLSTMYSASITGLSPFTSYTIEVQGSNSFGNSNILSITIRTLANSPSVSLVLTKRYLEELRYTWTTTLSCDMIEYSYIIGSNNAIVVTESLSSAAKTRALPIEDLAPNTTVKVAIRVKSIASYDSMWSEYTPYVEGTTYDIAKLTSETNMIFGNNFIITKTNPSGNSNRVEVEAGDNYVDILTILSAGNSINRVPTDDQLDTMYMQYKNTNNIPIRYHVITVGKSKEYYHTSDGIVTLTGNMKTSHIGVDNIPKRCKVWIGDENKIPRRCVSWIGDNSKVARRCI